MKRGKKEIKEGKTAAPFPIEEAVGHRGSICLLKW